LGKPLGALAALVPLVALAVAALALTLEGPVVLRLAMLRLLGPIALHGWRRAFRERGLAVVLVM
jgi:hypothetical protein